MNEHELIKKVGAELATKLTGSDSRFEFITQSEWISRNFKEVPDLVVHDKQQDNYLVLEVKHYNEPRPLSLSAIPLARQIKDENSTRGIEVAIVTNSDIPNILRTGLKQENIPVIQYTSAEQAVENVMGFIDDKSSMEESVI